MYNYDYIRTWNMKSQCHGYKLSESMVRMWMALMRNEDESQ